ncbi:ubiquinone biosynthesis monooxygenase COQ6, mitochondrial-like isoform X2 [Tubulanus polymorphus]|uniref:ubiquinone biosynthesis monooxygenase COQ6, mitochondrial-like isoform X2 n=1 Tax=Tubulanus polymorphus TaxID=672921 RepID=UPI003DA646E4
MSSFRILRGLCPQIQYRSYGKLSTANYENCVSENCVSPFLQIRPTTTTSNVGNVVQKTVGKISTTSCSSFSTQQTTTNKIENADITEKQLYDVVISGGGMVGTAMASALGNDPVFSNKNILLLESMTEKSDFVLKDGGFSNRVCALSPATVKFLSGIGAWDEICSLRLQPVKMMQVWDACSDAMINFDLGSGDENLAYIVENDVIIEGIKRSFPKSDNIKIQYSSQVKEYSFPESDANDRWVKIQLDNGDILQTRLLIGADGFRSLAKDSAKIQSVKWEYDQTGIVAVLHLSEPIENNVAWQRFLPTGPIAMLPLSETRSNLIWSTTREQAKVLMSLKSDSFVDAVNNAYWDNKEKDNLAVNAGQWFGQFLSTFIPDSTSTKQLPPTVVNIDLNSRAVFPLGLSHATHYVKPRLALIGDAAHRIHPLAGQGVNLGFGDAACLHEKLKKAVQNGTDIGALTNLIEYETLRQRHVVPVMATIDGLSRLYNTSFSPLVLLRSLGLQATNSSSLIKDKIMEYAMKGIQL